MLVDIYLKGIIGDRFAKHYRLDVQSPGEALHALCVLLPGFRAYFSAHHYQLYRDAYLMDAVDKDHHQLPFRSGESFTIMPCVSGTGRGGVGKIILGIATIGLSFVPGLQGIALTASFNVAGSIASFGVSLALGGISQLLAPTPKGVDPASREIPDARPSFLFDGPVNVQREGAAIPLVYGGPIRTGSLVVSAQITTTNI